MGNSLSIRIPITSSGMKEQSSLQILQMLEGKNKRHQKQHYVKKSEEWFAFEELGTGYEKTF